MNVEDIIRYLQSYKGYLQAFLGYPVLLMLHPEGIRHKIATGQFRTDDILVDRTAHIPVLSQQVRAGYVIRIVDGWMQLLDDVEREVIFRRYIDHEFERPKTEWEKMIFKRREKMIYKTLTYRRIEKMMGVSDMTVKAIAMRALDKILKVVES